MYKVVTDFLEAIKPFMPLNYTPKDATLVSIEYIVEGQRHRVNFPTK